MVSGRGCGSHLVVYLESPGGSFSPIRCPWVPLLNQWNQNPGWQETGTCSSKMMTLISSQAETHEASFDMTNQWFPKCGPRAPASPSGDLLEMRFLGPRPRPRNQTPGGGAQQSPGGFSQALQGVLMLKLGDCCSKPGYDVKKNKKKLMKEK